ncbi:DegT/DnrJ/EryC1/StrS family aminotransferase [Pseudodesulfovibrio piezophilus]|uniref:Spore coat polysaccharide biosynthesis protein spsC n=1 Tax=Pseudodesulfovibrio piezophilus (strain DSM 21447 / JCM 15486 / C1TLV30) TaxID=1322246 RepID=M1WMM1_PSEP2|nr:DegT/DnrJ/EryC1/StrS family aminotransferase [Pseudodesulfovibrio piezophilus]CCH49795.1 Spore coat polysaccharide biosynthesis protein spsC [Pseudodesulfovibrio piezophilus C1TLV30]
MPVRSKNNFLIFGSPRIEQDEIDEVVASMEAGWLGTGPKVAKFESDFATYLGSGHAAACNSCTAALHLGLVALGLKPGDEVITTPLTFCASVNAIIHAGCTPVLADVDPVSMNIDPESIRAKITKRTKAILPVHFAGRACDMDAIMSIATEHDLKVVEDCAHAIETTYKGQHVGTFGNFGCFSFYVTKNVCTGEGGMVMANSEEDIKHVKILGLHGMSADAWKRFSDDGYKHYQVVEAGFKYNMMDIQAAIGIHQLKRVEEYHVRRRHVWDMYMDAFKALPIGLPAPEEPDTRHALHLFTILIDPDSCGVERDEFLIRMTHENIGVGVHYLSIPEQPYYRERFGWTLEDTPHAVRLGRQTVSLPLSAKLTDQDVLDVIQAVKKSLAIS